MGFLGKHHTQETKKRISIALSGRVLSVETKEKIALSKIGNTNGYKIGERKPPFSVEHKMKLMPTMFRKGQPAWNAGMKFPELSGTNSSRWRGGITPINKKIRNSLEFREWRDGVFRRDDYRCFDCGQRGGKLHAHHIYPFAKYPRLRLMPENGITLCEQCHRIRTFQQPAPVPQMQMQPVA